MEVPAGIDGIDIANYLLYLRGRIYECRCFTDYSFYELQLSVRVALRIFFTVNYSPEIYKCFFKRFSRELVKTLFSWNNDIQVVNCHSNSHSITKTLIIMIASDFKKFLPHFWRIIPP